MRLEIEVAESNSHGCVDAVRCIPVIHPDGSVTIGDDGEAWVLINSMIGDFDMLIDIE
jgi:hypothetical protein